MVSLPADHLSLSLLSLSLLSPNVRFAFFGLVIGNQSSEVSNTLRQLQIRGGAYRKGSTEVNWSSTTA